MSQSPEELARKIKEAKDRPPAESPLPKSGMSMESNAGLRMGTDFIASIAVGVFLGYWIDRWLGIKPFGMIAFLFLGFVSGVMRMQRLQTQETANEDKKSKKEPEKAEDTTKDRS